MSEKESSSIYAIRLALGHMSDVRIFRNSVGSFPTENGYITYGLGTGTSDLIGFERLLVTPEMVGKNVACFVAIECKSVDGRTDKKQLRQQQDFIRLVRSFGGLAGFARSVNDAKEILNQAPGVLESTDD